MLMARVMDGGLRVERQVLMLRDILYPPFRILRISPSCESAAFLRPNHHLCKSVATPIPKSFDKRVMYRFTLVFQYIDNIGI
jgi:hypothetical protein